MVQRAHIRPKQILSNCNSRIIGEHNFAAQWYDWYLTKYETFKLLLTN